jgi:hypothetical protein
MTEPLLVLDDQELELDRQQHPEVAHIANTNSESQPPSRPAHTFSHLNAILQIVKDVKIYLTHFSYSKLI